MQRVYVTLDAMFDSWTWFNETFIDNKQSRKAISKELDHLAGVNSYDVRYTKDKDRMYPIEIIGDFVDYIFSKKGVLSKYKKNKIKTS